MGIYPYWIENKLDGSYSLWTKVDIPNGSSKVLYVKQADGYFPNGADVFEFFDDFDGAEIDTTKWNLVTGDYPSVRDSCLVWSDTTGRIEAIWEGIEPNLVAFETLAIDVVNVKYVKLCGTVDASKTCSDHDARIYTGNSNLTSTYKDASCNYHYAYVPPYQDGLMQVWYKEDGCYIGANEDWGQSAVQTYAMANGKKVIPYFESSTTTTSNRIDWIRVRKFLPEGVDITTEKLADGFYKVTITNNSGQDLIGNQIEITGIDFIAAKDASVLVVDVLSYILFSDGTGAYKIGEDGSWQKVAAVADLTQDIFLSEGSMPPVSVSKEQLQQLGDNPQVLVYVDGDMEIKGLRLGIVPPPQVVVSKSPIPIVTFDGYLASGVSLNNTGSGDTKFVISPDGSSWYTWNSDTGAWERAFDGDPKGYADSILSVGITSMDNTAITKFVETFKQGDFYIAVAMQVGANVESLNYTSETSLWAPVDVTVNYLGMGIEITFAGKGKYLVIFI